MLESNEVLRIDEEAEQEALAIDREIHDKENKWKKKKKHINDTNDPRVPEFGGKDWETNPNHNDKVVKKLRSEKINPDLTDDYVDIDSDIDDLYYEEKNDDSWKEFVDENGTVK